MSPSNGGSNANDFQPTTRNPQEIPSNLFQQQGGVQSVTNTQELLNDQQNVTISITRAPAQAAPQAAAANETPIGFIVLMAVMAALLIVIYRWRSRKASVSTELTDSLGTDEKSDDVPASAEPATAEMKPVKAKKKSSKKSKPRRR